MAIKEIFLMVSFDLKKITLTLDFPFHYSHKYGYKQIEYDQIPMDTNKNSYSNPWICCYGYQIRYD